jgi:hypothetical protein
VLGSSFSALYSVCNKTVLPYWYILFLESFSLSFLGLVARVSGICGLAFQGNRDYGLFAISLITSLAIVATTSFQPRKAFSTATTSMWPSLGLGLSILG